MNERLCRVVDSQKSLSHQVTRDTCRLCTHYKLPLCWACSQTDLVPVLPRMEQMHTRHAPMFLLTSQNMTTVRQLGPTHQPMAGRKLTTPRLLAHPNMTTGVKCFTTTMVTIPYLHVCFFAFVTCNIQQSQLNRAQKSRLPFSTLPQMRN